MKHILIPVDFSHQSWNTACCALDFYTSAGMRFYLFFSEELEYTTNESVAVCQNPVQKMYNWMQELKTKLAAGQVLIPLKWEGDFIADVRNAVFDNEIDLIIMSTHYPNILTSKIKDSHVRNVITRIKCPVFIIPRDITCIGPNQVVLITDFNFNHPSTPTTFIRKFIHKSGAHLNVVQLSKTGNALSPSQQRNKEFLQMAFAAISHSFHFVIDKTMEEAFQFFVGLQQADVVILFAKNINLSEDLLFSKATKSTIDYHKSIPFLVVHE